MFALVLLARAAAAQVSVTTYHNDAARTGANLSETVLTASNVNVTRFGKLFERTVDDQIYGQPLYVSGVNIPGVGVRNVVYVATVSNTVYAFDADNPSATNPLWVVRYANAAAGIVPLSHTDVGQACTTYLDFSGNIGIVGTPTIDITSQTMYFVVSTKESGVFRRRLHAVDIRNGSERQGSPVLIQASVRGTGVGHDAQNNIAFNAITGNQRSPLLLANGLVYIAWASYCDTLPYHGWVLGYDMVSLRQVAVYNTSPNGRMAGIWPAKGLSADQDGNLYAVTGNGTFDGSTGGSDRGESFVKLGPTGVLLDSFTPYNWDFLNTTDQDLGIQGALLLPDTNLMVGGGKEGVLYVIDRNDMGGFQSGSNSQIVQSFQGSTSGRANGGPVYWNSPNQGPGIYLWPAGDSLKMFRFSGGRFQTTPIAQSSALAPSGMPGAMLSVSANGDTVGTGIVWAALSAGGNPNISTQPGILRAYDASNVTRELWNSQQNAGRDSLGNFSKFSAPTVANGKVYMATFSNKLVVYGLLPVPPGTGTGTGLTAQYYNDPGTGTHFGALALTRTDATVNFNWGTGAPGPGVQVDNFSVRWSGQVQALTTGNHTFSTVSDDGVRLWVNGQLVINNWTDHAQTTNTSAPIALVAGTKYALTMEFYERTDWGVARLLWAYPGQTQTVIPQSQLYPTVTSPPQPPSSGTGLTAQYYNDLGTGTHFGALALTRTDATVNFNWGTGAPGPGVQVDNFSVRWSGQVQARATGNHTFSTVSDDGVRLWVNGQLVINNWTDHAQTTNTSAPIALVAGTKYALTMEFYERTGGGVARLLWAYPGQTQTVIPQAQLFQVPNQSPIVNAGPDRVITLPAVASLNATATDDGLPSGTLTATWIKASGREDAQGGTVVFSNPHALSTTATFGADGIYVLRLTVSDGALTANDDVTITVNPATGGTGTGLTGRYYNDPGTGTHFGALALTRTDATVDFDWGTGAPGPGVQADNFSVRWSGQVQALTTGNHTFSTVSDDGVRLWVNGQLVINNWTDHAQTTNTSAPIALVAGTKYALTMEFYERTGGGVARLLWAYPGQTQMVIPGSQLFP